MQPEQQPHVATTNPEQRLQTVEANLRALTQVTTDHIENVLKRIDALEQSLRPTPAKGKVKE